MAYVLFCGLLGLFASFNISAAKKDICDVHAAIGLPLTLPFTYEKLADTDNLKWRHNHTVIFQREKSMVSVCTLDYILQNGSLVVKNPQITSAGTYEAQVYNVSGSILKASSTFVCVVNKVPKPTLKYSCDQKSQVVHFSCDVVKTQDLQYSWAMDEQALKGEARATLSTPLNKLKTKHSFTCSVSNQVSNERSDPVNPACESPSPSTQNVLCFQPKTVMAVLGGGAGLIVVLFIVIMALCCCRRSRRHPKCTENKEPKMLSLTKREADPVSADYETMHAPEISLPPQPLLGAENHRDPNNTPNNALCNTIETVHDSLPPAAPTERQDPSPVPKPRTKRPQTPDI